MWLEKLLAEKAIDLAFSAAKHVLFNKGGGLKSDETSLESHIEKHLNFVANWCEKVSFLDLKKAKYTDDIYIPLDLYVTPRKVRIVNDEKIDALPLNKAVDFSDQQHFIILGGPGAGKTTTMKHICRSLLTDSSDIFPDISFPIVIRLRELNQHSTSQLSDPTLKSDLIWSLLHDILGLKIEYPSGLEEEKYNSTRSKIRKNIILETLESLKPLIVLDGYDEVTSKKNRELVLKEIRELGTVLDHARVIVTSRTGGFNFSIDRFDHFEIKSLDNQQIETFVNRWLIEKTKVSKFLNQLKSSPFSDTTIRPLTIAHLCAIFERTNKIPEKPKTVYKKVVSLLIEEWDEQRSISRGSKYSNFEPDRKFEFLCYLAYVLTTITNKSVFSDTDLKNGYKRICENFGLPQNESSLVSIELESHTGLLLETGYKRYEFTHKSIQEYLAAEHIVKLPIIPEEERFILRTPNELAIAVAISSNPSIYLYELVFRGIVKLKKPKIQFIHTFINRILVEKPDFHLSKKVGWALIVLYSLHFGSLIDSPQRELFLGETLGKEFNLLADLIKERTSKHSIMSAYVVVNKEKSIENTVVVTLDKKENITSKIEIESIGVPINILPSTIRVKDNILEG